MHYISQTLPFIAEIFFFTIKKISHFMNNICQVLTPKKMYSPNKYNHSYKPKMRRNAKKVIHIRNI